METGKKCLLILVIFEFLAVCRCGPTCHRVGLRVNGQNINKPPKIITDPRVNLILDANDCSNDLNNDCSNGIKFSYWYDKYVAKNFVPWTDEKIEEIYVRSYNVDMPNELTLESIYGELTLESIYGESEGRLHKCKNLLRCASGTDRDTSDSKHRKRRSSSGSQSSIEPNNCENEKTTFVNLGVGVQYIPWRWKKVNIYGRKMKNSKYSFSIGYSRENQEPIFYLLPLIAKGWQEYILLTLDEDGKIIQDGFALSADRTDYLSRPDERLPRLILHRKNHQQKFPEELFFEKRDKLTGDLFYELKYKFNRVAEQDTDKAEYRDVRYSL